MKSRYLLVGLSVAFMARAVPAAIIEDSIHMLEWTPGSPAGYGGQPATPATAKFYNNNASTCYPSGSYVTDRNIWTNQAAYCNSKAQAQAVKLMQADAPASCYLGQGTIESIYCGRVQVCGYGGSCTWQDVYKPACHIVVTKSENNFVTTPFIVADLDYQLPGNASKVTYGTTVNSGTTWTTKNTAGVEVKAGLKQGVTFSGGGSYQLQTTDTKKLSFKSNSTTTQTSLSDFPDHNNDIFSLWINNKANYWRACFDGVDHAIWGIANDPNTDSYVMSLVRALGYSVDRPAYLDVTAGELLNPALCVDPVRCPFLATLSPEAIDSILMMDPFFDPVTRTMLPTTYLDPARFRDVQGTCGRNFSLYNTSSQLQNLQCSATYTRAEDHNTTHTWSASFSYGFKFLGEGRVTLTETYSDSTSVNSQTDNQADITLSSRTPGLCWTGQLAVDSLFNKYIVTAYQVACQ